MYEEIEDSGTRAARTREREREREREEELESLGENRERKKTHLEGPPCGPRLPGGAPRGLPAPLATWLGGGPPGLAPGAYGSLSMHKNLMYFLEFFWQLHFWHFFRCR